MREFVGLADHEGVERVAQVQLMVVRLKIQLGLLWGRHGGCRRGFFLGANVVDLEVWRANLTKDGLDDVAVSAGKHLPEDRAGDLYVQTVAFGAAQPGGLEPSRVGVDADP